MFGSRAVHPESHGHTALKRVGGESEVIPSDFQLPLDGKSVASRDNSDDHHGPIHIELGSHLSVNHKQSRPVRNRRKKSYNEPTNTLVIREADEQNNDRLGVPILDAARLKSEPYGKVSGENGKFNQKGNSNRMISRPSEDADLDEIAYGEPTIHISQVDRYTKNQKTKANQAKRIKSSKQPNSSIFMMQLSSSVEDPRLHSSSYKRKKESNIQLTSHESSNLIFNEHDLSDKVIQERKTKISTTVGAGKIEEFDFWREKKCFASCSNPQFALTFKNASFLINAKKEIGNINSRYNISVKEGSYNPKEEAFVGYLKGNFSGSEFNLYQADHHQDKLIATIYYEPNCSCCTSNYRKLEVFFRLPSRDNNHDNRPLKEIYEDGGKADVVRLVSKAPEWNQKHGVFILSLKGKSKIASRKNMVLIEESKASDYILMICKTGDNKFHVQLGAPLTPLIGVGILLTSFDFKLCCQ